VYGTQLWKSYQTYQLQSEIARLGGDIYDIKPSGIEALFQPLMRPRAEPEVSVYLRDTDVDDQWISNQTALKNFPNLTLNIAGTQVTDEGLKCLATLPNLRGLNIEGTRVSDRGLAHLSGLPHLKLLCLGKTQVTDAGLKQLSSLPELRVLYLRNTQTSGE
jgi:Leucine-rich repeat (LRR) protein